MKKIVWVALLVISNNMWAMEDEYEKWLSEIEKRIDGIDQGPEAAAVTEGWRKIREERREEKRFIRRLISNNEDLNACYQELGGGLNPLTCCVGSNYNAELMMLLAKKVDINRIVKLSDRLSDRETTAIHEAIFWNNLAGLKELLDHGAKTDITCKNQHDPLYSAVSLYGLHHSLASYKEAIILLKSYGAHSQAALELAQKKGFSDLVEILKNK
jgi:hypothetical protein